jgi:hypothetical protein
LKHHIAALDDIARILQEKEVISGAEIAQISHKDKEKVLV